MSLSLRLFIAYFLLMGLSIWFILQAVTTELIPGMRQSLEEVLVDTANLLAEIVEQEVSADTLNTGRFSSSMMAFHNRRLEARIYSLQRTSSNLEVYITDANGIVVYDSTGRHVGADYSQWNDVYLTLSGKYGARTTRTDPLDDTSSVMHVAAPIKAQQKIIGVLTVAKPSASVQPFFEQSVRTIKYNIWLLLTVSFGLLILIVYWLTLSIRKLTRYAQAVRMGKRVAVPRLREKELAQLAVAMDEMRDALEGKDYVENYLHALTHELKSPLAAIQGAAELLDGDMPEQSRLRFVNNIANEAQRLRQIVEKLLQLAELEKRQKLTTVVPVATAPLIQQLCDDKSPLQQQRQVVLRITALTNAKIEAERFLVQQAISNLLDNALAFSLPKGVITVSDAVDEQHWHLTIRDHGPGIPDYALSRVFERFYSLPRPDTGNKSTGLGLSLVQEVAQLHGGTIQLSNHPQGGAEAHFCLPLRQNPGV